MGLDGLDVARVELQEHPHGRKDLRIVDRLVLGRENSELPDLQEAAVVLLGNLAA